MTVDSGEESTGSGNAKVTLLEARPTEIRSLRVHRKTQDTTGDSDQGTCRETPPTSLGSIHIQHKSSVSVVSQTDEQLMTIDTEDGGGDEVNGYITVGFTRPDGSQLGTQGIGISVRPWCTTH